MIGNKNYKKVLITGGTSGLGLALARLFIANGSEVWISGRKMPESLTGVTFLHFIRVDFSDLQNVRSVFSELFKTSGPFDLVVNNAGVLTPSKYTVTKDDFEYSFQVNFLAHLLIDDLAVSMLPQGIPLRIVQVTSPVYRYVSPSLKPPERDRFRFFKTYCESKLYLLYIPGFLGQKYANARVSFTGFDPGIFSSGIYRMQRKWFHSLYRVGSYFMRSPERVAGKLFAVLSYGSSGERIYKSVSRFRQMPDMNEETEKFLLSCYDAIEIVR